MFDEVSHYRDLVWLTLQAVIALGGAASISELDQAVIDREDIPVNAHLQGSKDGRGRTELQNRLAWARTYLKGMGLLNNSQKGYWEVTDSGMGVTEEQIPAMLDKVRADLRHNRSTPARRRTRPPRSAW